MSSLGLLFKVGGRFYLKLNIGERLIVNKYCEGKMKSILERELKVCEIVEREVFEVSYVVWDLVWFLFGVFFGSKLVLVCVVGEVYGECGIFGCVIVLCRIWWCRLRNVVCFLGGFLDIFIFRMLV